MIILTTNTGKSLDFYEDLLPENNSIVGISFNGDIDQSFMLKRWPNINKIDIESCNNMDALNLNDCQLEKIKFIRLSRTIMSYEKLSSLLNKACNIEYLSIIDCNIFTQNIFPIGKLNKLMYFCFDNSEIKFKNYETEYHGYTFKRKSERNIYKFVSAILLSAINLEQLEFRNCIHIADIDLTDVDLPILSSLCLYKSDIKEDWLFELLTRSKNIQNIKFDTCSYNKDNHNILGLYLVKLNKMCIYNCNIDNNGLLGILNVTSNIQTLELELCENISGFSLQNKALMHLKYLRLIDCKITSQGLFALIYQARDICWLEIINCDQLTEFNFQEFKLNMLTHLFLSRLVIDNNQLSQLLTKTPNIKQLTIVHCKNITSLNVSILSQLQFCMLANLCNKKNINNYENILTINNTFKNMYPQATVSDRYEQNENNPEVVVRILSFSRPNNMHKSGSTQDLQIVKHFDNKMRSKFNCWCPR